MFTMKKIIKLESTRTFLNFIRHKPSTIFGLTMTIFFAVITLLDFFLPQYLGVSNAQDLQSFSNMAANINAMPHAPTLSRGWRYIFGTTFMGLPIFPVMLASIATDIEYSLMIVVSSMIIGMLVGVFSSYFGTRTDMLVMRGVDIFLSFPAIIVVILYCSAEGWNYVNISIGVILVWWTTYARISRSTTLPLRFSNYVEAGIASGCSKTRSIFSHIIPNIFPEILVQMFLDMAMVVTIFATVNFLFASFNVAGALTPEISNMMVGFPTAGPVVCPGCVPHFPFSTSVFLADGTWWPIVIPGVFLVLFITSINMAGETLRDYLNPQTRTVS